jgi:hypothetical protein
MNSIFAYDSDVLYRKVSKLVARKAFDEGRPVILCPGKLRPFGVFRPSCMIQKGEYSPSFADSVEKFCWYNTSYEVGYYPSYWVRVLGDMK